MIRFIKVNKINCVCYESVQSVVEKKENISSIRPSFKKKEKLSLTDP